MKKVVYWLTLFLLFSHGAFAAPNSANHNKNARSVVSCNFLGQHYTEVQYKVVGAPTYQEVYVSQGSKKPQVLWYTQDYKNDTKDTDYIFNEQSLIDNVQYEILFVNDADNKLARYYRRNLSAGNQYWQLIEEKVADLDNGNLTVIGEGEVSSLACSSSTTVPEVPEIELDICEYVPNSAQTNNYVDGLPSPSSELNITSSDRNFIYLPSSNPILSFANLNVSKEPDENCKINGSQAPCDVDAQLTFPNFPPELEDYDTSDDTIYHDIECPDLCELKPGKYRNVLIKMNATLTLHSGSYYFNEINFSEQNTSIELEDKAAEVHYKKIKFGGPNITLNEDGETDNLLLIGHGIDSGIDIGNENVVINGYVYVDPVAKNNGGFILSGRNTTIKGGVSASSVNVAGSGNHTIGQFHNGECSSNSVEGDDYELSMSPGTQLALMCGSDLPTFEIVTKSGSDFVSTPVNISIPNANVGFTLNATTGSGNVCSISSSSDSCSFTSDSNGKLVLTIAANSNNAAIAAHSYNLRASLAEDSDQSQTASFSFVPYKIDVKPHSESAWNNQVIPAIANKSVTIDARVLACPVGESSAPVVLNYNKTLNNSALSVTLSEPSTGSGNVSVNNMQFVDGQTGSGGVAVTFDESGEASVVIKDAGFSCSNFQELVDPDTGKCPIEGEILQGTFSVKARPWKFAVCALDSQGNNTAANGDSKDENSVGYVAAGESFFMRVAPLKYASSECDALEDLTKNYFLSDASVELTHELHTPEDGTKGSLTGTLTSQIAPSDIDGNGYIFSDLKYDEVGSIQLTATETGALYSSIQVDGKTGVSGESNVGRFYPDYFKVTNTEWVYPERQGDSVYMGQDFTSVMFEVTAYNAKGEVTQNYGNFADKLKANMYLAGEYSDRLTILDADLTSQNWTGGIWSKTWKGDTAVYWLKDLALPAPDGPFNSKVVADSENSVETLISLSLSHDGSEPSQYIDPSLFLSEAVEDTSNSQRTVSQQLLSQPDVRFGRIQLDDVGGYQGATLTVPLRVEYWNGERFVLNTSDDGTTVYPELEGDQDFIWPDDGDCRIKMFIESDVTSTVSDGVTRELLVKQDSDTCNSVGRQQTEVWLKLSEGSNELPWLKYNWDSEKSGEENPSSVVTFGIHRGNDRVIYRGEPGLTGL